MKSRWKRLKNYVFATYLGLCGLIWLFLPDLQIRFHGGWNKLKIAEIDGIGICTITWYFYDFKLCLCHFCASCCQTLGHGHDFQKKTRITAFLVFWNSFSSQVSIKRVECWNIPETNPPGVQSQVPHASILRNSSFLTGVSVVSYHLCKIHLAKIAAKERRRNQSKFPNPDIYIYIYIFK